MTMQTYPRPQTPGSRIGWASRATHAAWGAKGRPGPSRPSPAPPAFAGAGTLPAPRGQRRVGFHPTIPRRPRTRTRTRWPA